MDADTVLILGLLTVGFSIPTMVSAISDSRAPRAAIVTTLVGGSLIFYAFKTHPDGDALEDLSNVFST